MIYEYIGRAVVKAAKVFLRRKYGPTLVPKPVLGVAVVGTIVAVAAFAAKRDESASA